MKESIRTSKSVNALTDFQFRLWAYLITYVDDYGRAPADPDIIKGFVFPKRKGVTDKQIAEGLHELANTGMIVLYEVDGDSFLCFPKWGAHQNIRAKESKYPAPLEDASTCKQMNADASRCMQTQADVPVLVTRNSILDTRTPPVSPSSGEPDLSDLPDGVQSAVRDWLAYKRERRESYKPTGLSAFLNAVRQNTALFGEASVVGVIRASMANGYRGVTWDRLGKQPNTRHNDAPKADKARADLDRWAEEFLREGAP